MASPLARSLYEKNSTTPQGMKTPSIPLDSVDSPFLEGYTKLYKAIQSQDEELVEKVLNQHPNIDPNRLNSDHGMTPLHFAVGLSDNTPNIVELLLKRGGHPNNTNTGQEERISPMHLSCMYDYDIILKVLLQYGGDPKIFTGDKKNCYDIARDNLESEMLENCFQYFYQRVPSFRKSIKPTNSVLKSWTEKNSQCLSENFYSCQSSTLSDSGSTFENSYEGITGMSTAKLNGHSYLMTEDESTEGEEGCSSNEDGGRLSTIDEESTVSTAYVYHQVGYQESIGDDSTSVSDPSCANSTPPMLPDPTSKELKDLQNKMKNLQIPVTLTTFGVLNKYAHQASKLAEVLSPKSGKQNFSSELQLCLQNLNLVVEWGNLKIDLLQNFTPTGKTSKSFYNYLLLDPKIIKKANFSGNHLKSSVIKNTEKFETFLKAIFYVGKGCGRRPIQHLVDAKAKLISSRNSNSQCGEKIDKILEIWKTGLGVIIVSVFHHSSEREANVNEASMIDAVGLVELSNIKKGSYGGTIATSWSQKTKNQFGSFLLHKCFCAFAVGDHKSFYPQDI